MDSNGILVVSACDKATKNVRKIVISNDTGRLSKEQIQRMVREAEQFADADARVREALDARHELEGYIYAIRKALADARDSLSAAKRKELEAELDAASTWLERNESAPRAEVLGKQQDLEALLRPVFGDAVRPEGGGGGGGGGAAPRKDDAPNIADVD